MMSVCISFNYLILFTDYSAPERINYQGRFRQLVEEAAVNVKEPVMDVLLVHFSGSMQLVETSQQAAMLYSRAAKIPRSVTEVMLRNQNISVGEVFNATETTKSILLEVFEDGKPCLLKIDANVSIEHEMEVWRAINEGGSAEENHLVPLKLVNFKRATAQMGDLSGGLHDPQGFCSGIMMQKYQSTLSRCKIPLKEAVLLRYGEQLRSGLLAMHASGYCHLDVKPANVFLWEGN